MDSHATWHWLPWDSEFFGLRIARLEPGPLTDERIRALRRSARSERIDCFYSLVDATDADAVRAAQTAGFHHTDVRVVLDRSVSPRASDTEAGDPMVESARAEDVPILMDIARRSHRASRFYADPRLPSERCDALYAHWIRASCDDFADHVWVARREGQASGYLSCHLDPERCGRIGLVAVAEGARGHALGRRLVDASLRWFAARGCERVVVTTQARNVPAQRLYQGEGFRTREVGYWYHWWPGDSA